MVYHVQLEGHTLLSSLILRFDAAVLTVFVCLRDQDAVNGYEGRFQDESLTERTTTDEYYDLATDFYLYGWGSSFHFATRFLGESLEDSIVRPGTEGILALPALASICRRRVVMTRVLHANSCTRGGCVLPSFEPLLCLQANLN